MLLHFTSELKEILMTLSILAGLFILFLIAIIFYGYGFVVKSTKPYGEENLEHCSVCRNAFEKRQLVEREIGDYKLMYFCKSCITALHDDAGRIP
jgi:hypothetical protein